MNATLFSERGWNIEQLLPSCDFSLIFVGSVAAHVYKVGSTDFEIEACVRATDREAAGKAMSNTLCEARELTPGRRFIIRTAGERIRGMKRSVPGTYPDPGESVWVSGVPVPPLPRLIECLLARARLRDLAYIVELIGVHNLDESFAEKIHPVARSAYLQCLDQKRDEDRYNPEIHDRPADQP